MGLLADLHQSDFPLRLCEPKLNNTPLMSADSNSTPPSRFRGQLRHYHRRSTEEPRTWDEWIDGKAGGGRFSGQNLKRLLRLLAIVVGVIALIGLVVALYIEMR